MIVIDRLKVERPIPPQWHDKAKKAIASIRAIADEKERAKAINAKSEVWGLLKEILASVSHDKCWYCESRQIRSDKAVDHFRPKNKVKGPPEVPGYWWLAFDWRNYRYSCNYCNSPHTGEETSGGKHDHFPLIKETERGLPEEPAEALERREHPVLLDPMRFGDTKLLTFDSDGSAVPAKSAKDDPEAYERARYSIEIYHLHNSQLREARLAKMQEVRSRLKQVTLDLRQDSPAYDEALVALTSMIQPDAEYSAAARAMMKMLRADYPIADDLLM